MFGCIWRFHEILNTRPSGCTNTCQMLNTQLTQNVSGTFGFGCMRVWLNLTLLEHNVYVRHWSYKCLVEPNVLKMFFKYSDTVLSSNKMQKVPNE